MGGKQIDMKDHLLNLEGEDNSSALGEKEIIHVKKRIVNMEVRIKDTKRICYGFK